MYSTGNTPSLGGEKENLHPHIGWGATAYRVWPIPYKPKYIINPCELQEQVSLPWEFSNKIQPISAPLCKGGCFLLQTKNRGIVKQLFFIL